MTSTDSLLRGEYFSLVDGKISVEIYAESSLNTSELEAILDYEYPQALKLPLKEQYNLKSYKHLQESGIEKALDYAIQLISKRFLILCHNLSQREKLKIFSIFINRLETPNYKAPEKLKKHLRMRKNRATTFANIMEAGTIISHAPGLYKFQARYGAQEIVLQLIYGALQALYTGDQRPFKANKKTRKEVASLGGKARYEANYKPVKEMLSTQIKKILEEQPSISHQEALIAASPHLTLDKNQNDRIKYRGDKLLAKWAKELLTRN